MSHEISGSTWSDHDGRTDISAAFAAPHVWLALGWHDIKQRYRRSIIGPFWFTLSALIMIGALGLVYSTLFGQTMSDYLPYLGFGLIVWQFISTCITEGSNGFISSGYLIKQVRLPLTIHINRIAWRNLIILLHSLPVVFGIMLFFGQYPSIEMLLVIPALVLLFFQAVWISLITATLCTRYRDVLQIVANLVTVLFFITPVFWRPETLTSRGWIAQFNPFYHMIETIRAPIIGRPIEWQSWAISLGLIVVGFILAHLLMRKCRDRVPYWL